MHDIKKEHGGNLDRAIAQYGGVQSDWIDLSTGINRRMYPVQMPNAQLLHPLPTQADLTRLCDAAKASFGASQDIIPVHGAQSAIQILPRLLPMGYAKILAPSYNEYQYNFERLGWDFELTQDVDELSGSDIAIVVNPNNPTGTLYQPKVLQKIARDVKLLVVDESFMDCDESASIVRDPHEFNNIVVLRSFGKFYGLAGLRLGFALGSKKWLRLIVDELGQWPVSTLACHIGVAAYRDTTWKRGIQNLLARDVKQMDDLARSKQLKLIGGTNLFRLYQVDSGAKLQTHLANHKIWTRVFSYAPDWIRFGLPGNNNEWQRLQSALKDY